MPASRLIILIAFAVIGGAATIALAYGWALTGAPIWQAAIGPLLLVAILVFKWNEARKKKS